MGAQQEDPVKNELIPGESEGEGEEERAANDPLVLVLKVVLLLVLLGALAFVAYDWGEEDGFANAWTKMAEHMDGMLLETMAPPPDVQPLMVTGDRYRFRWVGRCPTNGAVLIRPQGQEEWSRHPAGIGLSHEAWVPLPVQGVYECQLVQTLGLLDSTLKTETDIFTLQRVVGAQLPVDTFKYTLASPWEAQEIVIPVMNHDTVSHSVSLNLEASSDFIVDFWVKPEAEEPAGEGDEEQGPALGREHPALNKIVRVPGGTADAPGQANIHLYLRYVGAAAGPPDQLRHRLPIELVTHDPGPVRGMPIDAAILELRFKPESLVRGRPDRPDFRSLAGTWHHGPSAFELMETLNEDGTAQVEGRYYKVDARRAQLGYTKGYKSFWGTFDGTIFRGVIRVKSRYPLCKDEEPQEVPFTFLLHPDGQVISAQWGGAHYVDLQEDCALMDVTHGRSFTLTRVQEGELDSEE